MQAVARSALANHHATRAAVPRALAARGVSSMIEEGTPVVSLRGVTKRVSGGRTLFENAAVDFLHGAKIGILGLNGAGKSTLLKLVAGIDTEHDGDLWVRDGLTVGYLEQEPELDPEKDVFGNVMDGVKHKLDLVARFNAVSEEMAAPDADFDQLMAEQATLMERIEALNAWNTEHEVEIAMDALRCPPGDSDVSVLSGGEKRRVALARLLLSAPDMLMLDEPTNHLDAESVAWLEAFLADYRGCVLTVTHDRYFLDNITRWILEIENGQLIPYEGNYSTWLAKKAERSKQSSSRQDAQQKALEQELSWLQRNPRGGTSKQRARQQRAEGMKAEVSNQRSQYRHLSGGISVPPGPRLGTRVVSATGLTKSFDDRILFEELSFAIENGMRLGIVGGNGSGKSTLFRILSGELEADAGEVDIGDTVKMGVVAQSREDMNPENTVYQEIAQGEEEFQVGGRMVHVRAYTAAFNIKGKQQEKFIGDLSGGERSRVHMAKVLRQGVNLLLLDEPTNDLDVETLRSLEQALNEFEGAVVIISHDRYFLDRVCNATLAFEGNSQVKYFPGSYSEWEATRRKQMGAEWRPTRVQYKRAIKA